MTETTLLGQENERQDEEIYEVRTQNGGPEFIRFNRFHLFRRNWIFAYLPTFILIAVGVPAYLDGDEQAAILIGVLALLMPLLMLGMTVIGAKLHLRTNKMFKNMGNIYYRFDRRFLFNETVSPNMKSTIETEWSNVYRIYESADSFYIYISNMQAFIIPKADIITGSAEGLARMVKELAPDKYRKRG